MTHGPRPLPHPGPNRTPFPYLHRTGMAATVCPTGQRADPARFPANPPGSGAAHTVRLRDSREPQPSTGQVVGPPQDLFQLQVLHGGQDPERPARTALSGIASAGNAQGQTQDRQGVPGLAGGLTPRA